MEVDLVVSTGSNSSMMSPVPGFYDNINISAKLIVLKLSYFHSILVLILILLISLLEVSGHHRPLLVNL